MRSLSKGLIWVIIFLGFIIGGCITAAASAPSIYLAQSAVGSANGADCNDAYAYTFFNTAGNWGAGAAQIGPGTTVYLCGTITVPVNTTGLNVQGSGTSSNPITIFFEPNAILQSPAFSGCADGPASGSFGAGGGIEINGYNYIIVDGGTNGIIQNTANGTGLANHQCSLGLEDNGDYNIIRNLTITNIYLNQGTTSSATDNAGGSTADLYVNNTAHFMQICNNVLRSAEDGAEVNTDASGITPTATLPACSSNTFTSGTLVFFNNTLYDHNWQIHGNGSGAPSFYNNDISFWNNWFFPSASFHQDGIFFAGASSATYYPQIFNNYIHGDIVGGSPTGFLYFTDTGSADGTGQSANIYNNVFYGTGSTVAAGSIISTQQASSSNPKGPYRFINNTFINSQYTFQNYLSMTSPTLTIENNIFYGQSSSTYFYANQSSDGYSFSTTTFQSNDYFDGRTYGAFGLWESPAIFATWLLNCVAGGGSGCDSESVTTDPMLSGEASFGSGGTLAATGFLPVPGSAAINLATNLTSLCSTIAPLCYDKNGVQRPPTGAWDAGAFRYTGPASGLTATPH